MDKIVIYGLGHNFIKNYKWLQEEYHVVALADAAKHGEVVYGYVVRSPEELLALAYDWILVTPDIYEEIRDSLLRQGIPWDKIRYLDASDNVGNKLKCCFYSSSNGIGDLIIVMNYIKHFSERYRKCGVTAIRLVCRDSQLKLAETILGSEEYIDGQILGAEDIDGVPDRYDLLVKIKRYPEIVKKEEYRISRLCPELIDYIQICEKFKIFNPRYFKKILFYGEGAMYEELLDRKRIQQPDVYGYLGVTEEPLLRIATYQEDIEKYGLKEGQYITLHRGAGGRVRDAGVSTKAWAQENYIALAEQLKALFPERAIALIGSEQERLSDGRSIDIDLTGKLTERELLSVLKGAYLHLDVEGGLVHLRHMVGGGRSVVLFGPTSPEFFGYRENINIRTGACPYPCEWLHKRWDRECILENDLKNKCMRTITVDLVMETIKKELL